MGTTPTGFPYPEPGDPIAGGADAIKALAGRIDQTRMAAGQLLGPAGGIAAGAMSAAIPVAFPAGRFTQTPVVVITSSDARLTVSFASPTRNGFTIYARNPSPNASPQCFYNWWAIQMTATSGPGLAVEGLAEGNPTGPDPETD